MYQIQVKEHLVRLAFPPTDGWSVWVDVDAMELGKGKHQSERKRSAATASLEALEALGAVVRLTLRTVGSTSWLVAAPSS